MLAEPAMFHQEMAGQRVYFAARYSHRVDLLVKASELEADGHEVTSRWITGFQEGHSDDECAIVDEEDVRRADTLVFFAEGVGTGDRGGGGRHAEFGIAYALSKNIIVVGHPEILFHSLPGIIVAADWNEAKRAIRSEGRPTR